MVGKEDGRVKGNSGCLVWPTGLMAMPFIFRAGKTWGSEGEYVEVKLRVTSRNVNLVITVVHPSKNVK